MNPQSRNTARPKNPPNNYSNTNNHNHDGLKPKMSPLPVQKIMHKNPLQKNNRQKKYIESDITNQNQMLDQYYLNYFLQIEIQAYSKTESTMLKRIRGYYAEMRNIVSRCETKAVQMIKNEMEKVKKIIYNQVLEVHENIKYFQCKNGFQDNKIHEINVPYFEIQGDYLKNFEKIVERFQPNFVSEKADLIIDEGKSIQISRITYQNESKQKQNIDGNYFNKQKELQQAQQSTIKKPSYPPKAQNQHKQICQFLCEQELQLNCTKYNQNSRENKHEIASQIIMEEPSSCEDSLISNVNDVL